ncbi:MAG TPA: hypothetical protein DCG75_11940 [Bacteroidales bacterium]|nr:hypothetical protein [Bacteroidales bacterium]
MKKLIKYCFLFVIPVVIILIILPVKKRLIYQGLKDDCFNHGIWIHDRIYENNKPIDIAFLGSSHTINGINDKLITDKINNQTSVNFGYCRLGRNLNYVLLKEILKKKDLKKIIIEVRESENRYSHPIFPYIASTKDVIAPNLFFNRDILSDLRTHFTYKVEIIQDKIYKQETDFPIQENDFGFASNLNTASVILLDKIKIKRSVQKKQLTKIEQVFHDNFSRIYLNKIIKICNKNEIKIYFLYLPSYGRNIEKPTNYKYYQKNGELLIPPAQILWNQNNWHDEVHLNQSGAKKLSLWIANQIN